MGTMALYEYLCRDCDTSFEVRRAMGDTDGAVACPSGHTDVRRKLSTFVPVGSRASASPTSSGSGGAAGGCCGGACGCGR
jgi:putative FmdB family regulatory protein